METGVSQLRILPVPLKCQMSRDISQGLNSVAQAASGEGFRRKEGLGEESWSVGLNGALEDGLTEKGVPSTQGHEERHKGGMDTAAATTWANSVQRFFQHYGAEHRLRPCGAPGTVVHVGVTHTWPLQSRDVHLARRIRQVRNHLSRPRTRAFHYRLGGNPEGRRGVSVSATDSNHRRSLHTPSLSVQAYRKNTHTLRVFPHTSAS